MTVDLRQAVRYLQGHPAGVSLVASILAVAVGVATSAFTVADALIFRPAPFADPETIVTLSMRNEKGGPSTVEPAVLHAWRSTGVFTKIEGVKSATAIVGAPNDSRVARGLAHVTPGVFEMLGGVTPVRGRLFTAEDGRAGSDDRVLISEHVWRAVFNSDPQIVGRSIIVDDAHLQVIGVLPARFRFPE